jgi:hypothetical protein
MIVATMRSSAGSPRSIVSQFTMKPTFLRRRNHPRDGPNSARNSHDPIKADASAEVDLDRIPGWKDQEVIKCVIGRVYEQRVVQKRHDEYRRRQSLRVKDVRVDQVEVSRVQAELWSDCPTPGSPDRLCQLLQLPQAHDETIKDHREQ